MLDALFTAKYSVKSLFESLRSTHLSSTRHALTFDHSGVSLLLSS